MKEIKVSNNLKNIGKISTGTLIGQSISIVSVPILTRLYGANVIGYWALFNSVATVINSISDFGLTNAIMTSGSDEQTSQIYKVITSINLIISIISFFLVFIFYTIFPDNQNYDALAIGVIIAILVITLQQTQICYTWLNKQKKYNVLMKNPIINQLSIFVVSVIFAVFGMKKYGYFIGIVFGQIFTLINMKNSLPHNSITFIVDDYKTVFRENIDFVKYQMPTAILTNLKNQMPTFLIKSFFGTTMLGYYSITQKVLNIPTQFLANAIGRVFFSTTSEMIRNGENIGEYTFNNLKKATFISIVPMIGLIGFGNFIVNILFGSSYSIAADMLEILSYQALFTFLMMSTSGIYISIGKQSYALKSVIAQMIVYILGYSVGALIFKNIYVSLYIITIFYSLIQIIYFSFIFKALNISPLKYVKVVSIAMLMIIIGSLLLKSIINLLV